MTQSGNRFIGICRSALPLGLSKNPDVLSIRNQRSAAEGKANFNPIIALQMLFLTLDLSQQLKQIKGIIENAFGGYAYKGYCVFIRFG